MILSFARRIVCALSFFLAAASAAELPGDRMLAEYFQSEVTAISAQTFAGVKTLDDWKRQRETSRAQLREMLGLTPLPERTPLHATITGREEQPEFVVEKLHFQSMPGLYITANLYLPRQITGKLPAVLYISGHSRVREGNVSFGSKATYQHHGAWFARHGFVCLTIDSIGELAEIEGQHHGLHGGTRWWWSSRGYTPAGTETWNAMRALDYLETRPEVDAKRFGVTGRSGGGVATWWVAALDDRVKVAVPVAGMTDLQNQVVDGKASRHCDCMFMVNTYRWDFARIAALVAPRPLLFANSDKDDIFPLDGVIRMHRQVADIYKLYGASNNLALLITDGPHRDTQDLQVPAFRWMHRFLKGGELVVDRAATKFFTPAQLKVFATIPADQRNTRIDDEFVPAAKPAIPANDAEWQKQRVDWERALVEKCFAGWPKQSGELNLKFARKHVVGELEVAEWEFSSQPTVRLPLFVAARAGGTPTSEVCLVIADERSWAEIAALLEKGVSGATPNWLRTMHERTAGGELTVVYCAPRGIGPTAWTATDAEQIHIRRRFMLLGQTLEGMRVYDVRRALDAIGQFFAERGVDVIAERTQAVNALYASLFAANVRSLTLRSPSATHAVAPDYLRVLQFLDVPQAAAMAAARISVTLSDATAADWAWTTQAAAQLGWGGRWRVAH